MGTTADGVREIRKRKRAEALCVELGCQLLSGSDLRCGPHAETHAARMKSARRALLVDAVAAARARKRSA